jgi:hypothetical protein
VHNLVRVQVDQSHDGGVTNEGYLRLCWAQEGGVSAHTIYALVKVRLVGAAV